MARKSQYANKYLLTPTSTGTDAVTFRLNFRRQGLLWFFQSLAVGYTLPEILVRQRATSFSLCCTQLYGSPSLLRTLLYTFRYIVVNACAFSKACSRAHAQILAPRVYTLVLLNNVVHGYRNRWRLRANVCKSAVMVFSRNPVEGELKCGKHAFRVSTYTYLGIDFACNGAWDMHIQKVHDNYKKKVNQLHSIFSNRDILSSDAFCSQT